MEEFRYIGADYEIQGTGGYRVWYGQHYQESYHTKEEVINFLRLDISDRIEVLQDLLNKIEKGELEI